MDKIMDQTVKEVTNSFGNSINYDATISEIIKQIILERGIEIVKEPKVFCSILDDLIPQARTERTVIRRILTSNLELCDKLHSLYSMENINKEIELSQFKYLMKNNCGISDEWIEISTSAFFGAIELKNNYENQGDKNKDEESGLLDEWKQYEMGYKYEFGIGCEQDYLKALNWYKKSAAQNNSWAQNRLGDIYYNGNGVVQDYYEAVKWYKLAVENGDDTAQFNLGRCYYDGLGVQQNFKCAFDLFLKSAQRANSETAKKYASFYLAFCYENGLGVKEDCINALMWYRKSADAGFGLAEAKYCEVKEKYK
ncbi:tetratricopeptide repeat protein [Ruminococcus sp. zg-924]|uniref:tetratricopeptide repeat protein n=1 Tax=Ruminococcus sp. zg-924 TaxID=2678505 RepID=UPI00210B6F27|nr:tetratricopeptide repeat protein [Ruminococcus sp. zg-924]MCQ4022813.1 hypothetical protein [Ruminococcus sp. zg-924]